MTFIEKRNEIRPASGEAPFSLDEVFFSRTDDRGVIQAGNYVFRRVAHYDWGELLGAPHRLIRHPDMPRAVFWLMWDHLKRGEPVGAYVKNRAKDGLHYWVFAIIAPAPDGGYLSARIKPTSPLLGHIERLYAALRADETTQYLRPEDSAKALADRLTDQGFADYRHFAAHALSEELLARDTGLQAVPDPRIGAARAMLAAADRLRQETEGLEADFHEMRTIPHNMRVIASRLEPTGGPVSTLSQNYGAISREMADWFAENVVGTGSTFAAIEGTIHRSIFLHGMARILRECDQQLDAERRRLDTVDLTTERQLLARQHATYRAKSANGLIRVREEADRIGRACKTMNRHMFGLSSTRVLSKIESARTPGAGETLAEIIRQLAAFQSRIGTRLDRIAAESAAILRLTG
ncbi:PAS domain-containing protein [Sinisalibacter lacisalsi]|uniref:PAS fold-3 domain-containing protein n=1 Tax=Sinisalibacter lacisalsi TaxID=1526570 RepID=A0ABQ1QQ40_9RHOB|nr:PAS domain-containing protein [Sinisalibacter lacisalsi]GGD40544.1 hypothetical protein GCM10011358_25570 [Sinisalibacter lacisalsi]